MNKLREAGHELVSFHVPSPSRAASLFYKNLLPDRGEYTLQLYSKEIVSPYLRRFVTMLKVSVCCAYCFFFSCASSRRTRIFVYELRA